MKKPEDDLKAWLREHRQAFEPLEPRPGLWEAIEQQLPPVDHLGAFTQQHRAAFDVLEPRAELWGAIERQLDGQPAVAMPAPMTAARGGRAAQPVLRSWWQVAAAAVVVFGMGYGLRMGTEPAVPGAPIAVNAPAPPTVGPAEDASGMSENEPAHGFVSTPSFHSEPDPALNATLVTNSPTDGEMSVSTAVEHPKPEQIAPEIARLEARYNSLLARRRAEMRRFGPARPLADEWDREMAVLDSTYAELRHELTRNPNTDEVVEAMSRNLRLRMELLDQQARTLEAVQQARHRAERLVPRRPPSVNPDANGADDPSGWISPPILTPNGQSLPVEPRFPAPASRAAAAVHRAVVAA